MFCAHDVLVELLTWRFIRFIDSGTSGAGGCNGFYTMKNSFLMNQMYFCVVLQLIPRLSGLSWIIGAWQEEWENKDGLKAADSVSARMGKRCLCLSASCNHLLVASDNDFRWRWPHKWRQLLQFFGMPNVYRPQAGEPPLPCVRIG